MNHDINEASLTPLVQAALAEDWGAGGDITTDAVIDKATRYEARMVARQKGVLAGMECARLAFKLTDPALVFVAEKKDGDALNPGDVIAKIAGPAASLLKGERVALNFMTHLSGIATLTRRFVDEVHGTRAAIACTRKTIPGLRLLEKHAVKMGGGKNHRFTLDELVLIKDNHIAAAGSITEAVKRARAKGHKKVEVETDRLDQVEEALMAGADIIMLDNFTPDSVKSAVVRIAGKAVIEVSGGVTLSNVRSLAQAGPDIISVGALTHSAPSLDIGLDF